MSDASEQWTARHADGVKCDRATSTADCPRNHAYSDESTARVDSIVRAVASHLDFRPELDADMGGSFVLQIDLGRRGRSKDDPHDRAGIDPNELEAPRWWIDIEGGSDSLISDLGLDAEPETVAGWIAQQARAAGCPLRVPEGPGA